MGFFFCGSIETHIYENFIRYVFNYAFYKRIHILLHGGRKCLGGASARELKGFVFSWFDRVIFSRHVCGMDVEFSAAGDGGAGRWFFAV